MKSVIIGIIQKIGGKNIPISGIVNSIVEEYPNHSPNDIQEIIYEMCKNNEGIHFGTNINNNSVTISLDVEESVKLPPNQNPNMK